MSNEQDNMKKNNTSDMQDIQNQSPVNKEKQNKTAAPDQENENVHGAYSSLTKPSPEQKKSNA